MAPNPMLLTYTLVPEYHLGTFVVLSSNGAIVGRLPWRVFAEYCDVSGGEHATTSKAAVDQGTTDDRSDW